MGGPKSGDIFISGLFGGRPREMGGSVTFLPNGTTHTSNGANWGEGDKGARVSWNSDGQGNFWGIHGFDQNIKKPL
jgi:hypothetical protein